MLTTASRCSVNDRASLALTSLVTERRAASSRSRSAALAVVTMASTMTAARCTPPHRLQRPLGLCRWDYGVNDVTLTGSGAAHRDRARGRFGYAFPPRDQNRAEGAVPRRGPARLRVGC